MRPHHAPAVTRYDGATIAFHWLIALLVAVQWLIAQVIDLFPKGLPRVEVLSLHIALGLILGVLLVARIAWRATRGRILPPANAGVLGILARSVHYALYALLIAMVPMGMFLVYARGDSIFGLYTIPAFDPGNKALVHSVAELHELAATLILILAGFHAAAALIHHYIRHDGVLRRMLPGGI